MFSPRMLWGGRRIDGRTMGVRFPLGVGVADLRSRSRDLGSFSISLPRTGVEGRVESLSGDLCDGVGGGAGPCWAPPSSRWLRSRTELPVWSDCMRLCGLAALRKESGFSGETSATMRRAKALDTKALSRAFSVRAAWADWMALDVPAREVDVLGDCGFKGRGGGARSGSELSHLFCFLVSLFLHERAMFCHGARKVCPLTWAQWNDLGRMKQNADVLDVCLHFACHLSLPVAS